MQPTRRSLGVVAAFLLVVVLTACTSNGKSQSAANHKIRLVVQLFGDFGYDDLYKQYEASHPNIQIAEQKAEYAAHHQQLAQHLAAGSGAGDVAAIEEGFIAQFKATPDKFYNLFDFGAGSLASQWLPWKWAQSLSADGKTQIGLGTDVGSLAMCYRKDLLHKAGLPSDRDAVSKLWPDWASYIATGRKFMAANTGAKWFDAGANIYAAVLGQQPQGYYTPDNQLQLNGPGPKAAWDTAIQGVEAKLSAGLAAFSTDWNTGFQKGTFATVTCPAWMLAYIKNQAPKTAGLWDVASIPGRGGNWGGSFLTVPKQSKHPREAYDLAKFLTSPDSQKYLFTKNGTLPSEPALYDDPAVKSFKNPFFSGAPVGEIYTTAAKTLQPQYQGPKAGAIRTAFTNAILTVEQGKKTPDQAWQQGLKDAQAAAA